MSEESGFPAVDLTNCDREPIHLLGAIQPIGFLLALSGDWNITRASANAPHWTGRSVADMLGTPLAALFSAASVHTIRNRLASLQSSASSERAFGLEIFSGSAPFDVAVHLSGGQFIIECEPSEQTAASANPPPSGGMIGRLQRTQSLADLLQEAARQVRALTGFDRVMVYKLHSDDSGQVVAETVRQGIEPFLGLRYPASDIPRQARALYERNWLRIIADVDVEPVPIEPQLSPEGAPLDLSGSVLRAVSPIHIEYLRNMGVKASMSVSLLSHGKLWGLIACHHLSPRTVPLERRATAELLGQIVSMLIEAREHDAEAAFEARARILHDRLMTAVAAKPGAENLASLLETMREFIPCDGIGIWLGEKASLHGTTPSPDEFQSLIRFLNRTAASQIYATDALGMVHPPAADFAMRAAGLLAIPVSRIPRDFVVFFRHEIARSVTWAGNPNKPVVRGPNGVRLTPRKSFEAWQEIVSGRCETWTAVELRVAEALRTTLIEVVLRLANVAEQERKAALDRQQVLIAELNHRVRNILALINGLISRGRSTTASVEEYAAILDGRVRSLARAHDQITHQEWGPGPLRALLTAEASAFLEADASRIRLTGPEVLLQPQALSTLALVIHELITNSTKHGALRTAFGHVDLGWAPNGQGGLRLQWTETGGPPVQLPTQRGFGSTLIERSIPHDLGGEAQVEYNVAGLRVALTIPAEFVSYETIASGSAAPDAEPKTDKVSVEGSVLLVEDNMIIALAAEDMLLQLGASEVNIAATVGEAFRLLSTARPAYAVLDLNLSRETSLEVALHLSAAGVPYCFATGYSDELKLPAECAGVPIVSKPYSSETLGRALNSTRAGAR